MITVLDGGLTLRLRGDGRLLAGRNGTDVPVSVRQSFPWSEPARFLSLRDEDEKEFALVRDVTELEPASRRVLEEALVVAGFVLEVTRILALDEEIEVRSWKVETRQGPRIFQTRLDDWPRQMPGGGLLIRDVAGDLYHIASPGELDRDSRKHLWAFLD